jgi:C1A family cysteine protease
MKKVYLFITALLLTTSGFSQKKPERAPLNKEFKKYLESNKLKAEPAVQKNGYIPPPYKVSFQNFNNRKAAKAAQQLPSSYDLRDKGFVTPVKDQDTLGTCWAFSTLGAIESRWKMLEGTTFDLSEKNMVTCSGYKWGPDDGGNIHMATAYLNRFNGPIKENLDPYNTISDTASCSVHEDPVAYVPEARYLPDDIDEVKRMIMNYGAVATSMYANEQMIYYNYGDFTWYYDGEEPTNHGILIVGWDDNKLVTAGSGTPDVRGAWIVKNSWGSFFGEEGYFYLAYKDSKVLQDNAIFPLKWEESAFDSLHYYDKLGMVTSLRFGDTDVLYGLTRFTAQTGETVKKIGTYVNNYGSIIDITVYNGFDENTGQPVNPVDSIQNREVLYPGYYTFDVNAEVADDFYVKVKYDVNGYKYPLPVETSIAGYAEPNIESSGTHWISSNGNNWTALGSDINNNEYDLCIRAYTRKKDPTASFETDRNLYCLNDTVIFKDKSGGNISSYHWDFGKGAKPADTVDAGPHKVTYSEPGTKTIRLKVEGANGTDSLTRKDYIAVSDDLHIFFSSPVVSTVMGDTIEISVNGEAEEYEWFGETGLVSSSGPTARVTHEGDTEDTLKFKVTGTTGQCNDSDSVLVAFSIGPENDDVCSAIEITTGMNGPYNNEFATVQNNEPIPDTTGVNPCNEPMKWCPENGLQHTLWFKFIMPEDSGSVSFITSGLDTQIALYEAAECDDILNDNFTMLAANDDYFGEDKYYAAAMMDVKDLNKGQTYWLQMDGSAGGVIGNFDIEVKIDESTDIDGTIPGKQNLLVYPNPSSGEFSIVFPGGTANRDVQLEIYTPEGRKILNKTVHYSGTIEQQTIRVPNNHPGVYFLRIRSEGKTYHEKLIVH